MTKKQAFLTAVSGGTPDVVPVAPLIHCRYANRLLGRYDWKAVFEVHQKLGSCHHRGPIGIGCPSKLPEGIGSETRQVECVGDDEPESWYGAPPGSELREVERTSQGRVTTEWTIHTPKKKLVGHTVTGMIPHDPLVAKTTDYPVKTREDWLAYLEYSQLLLDGLGEPYLGAVEEAVEYMGEEGMPSVGLGPAYTALGAVRGMEGLIYDLIDYPDLMDELFAIHREIGKRSVQGFIDSPSEVAWLDICWATGSDLSPRMFERWSLPDVVAAMEIVKPHPGKYLGLYTLGKIGKYMPMFADAGVHFVSTFEPNEGDMTLAEAKRKYGDKMAILGNFNCVILAFGAVEEARAEARRCLNEGMGGGGYIMVTADEVPADAKWDNLRAMVETVGEYGRY